jgi:hypothetical protein
MHTRIFERHIRSRGTVTRRGEVGLDLPMHQIHSQHGEQVRTGDVR